MDIWTKEKRSYVMSKIQSKDTTPEKKVRGLLHHMGYRFRLHLKNLPGKPDIVLPKYRKVIFVHGCFWHMHKNCIDGKIPRTNYEIWKTKFEKNIKRDKINIKKLKKENWKVLVLWECEIEKDTEKVKNKLMHFFSK